MWQNGACFFDSNWNIQPCGKIWQQMTGVKNWGLSGIPNWNTDVTLTTDATGSIRFRGFFGNYDVTKGTAHVSLAVTPATSSYQLKFGN
jgi:protocatechuate 3,4-dioxygenase beta subunit